MADEWQRAKPKSAPAAAKADGDGWQRAPSKGAQATVDQLTEEDDPFFTGLMQGVTFGFSDELAAKYEAALSGRDYRDVWNEKQKEIERYRRLAPGKMLGGEVAGSVGTMFVPGLGVGNVAKLGRIPALLRAAQLAAAQGAVMGMGYGTRPYSDPEYEDPLAGPKIAALDAGKGAVEGLMGLGLAKAGSAAGKALLSPVKKPLTEAAKWTMERIAKPVFKVPQQVAKEVLDDPHVYRGKAQTIEEIAKDNIIPMANKVSEGASQAKQQALDKLTDNPTLSPRDLTMMILDKFTKRDVLFKDPVSGRLRSQFGPQVEQQLKSNLAFLQSLAGDKGYLTEKELQRFYASLETMAKYDRNSTGANKLVADAYKMARGAINETLGKKNTQYADVMESVATDTDAVEKLRKALKFGPGKEVRYEAVDPTFNRLRQIRKKETTQQILKDFAEKYGDGDTLAKIKRATNETHFGLKTPSYATMIGMASQSPELATVGFIRDVFGPNIFKQLAVAPSRGGPGLMDSILRPAAVTMSTSNASDPQFIGYPLYNISAEEYLRRMQEAQDSRTE
jgi:hypothetical protein